MILLRPVSSAIAKFAANGVVLKLVEHGAKKSIDAMVRMIGQGRRSGDTVVRSDAYSRLPKLELPAGYCYIVRDEGRSNRHRIGIVSQPCADLTKLKMETPFEVTVVALLECANAESFKQKLCHEFARKREGSSKWYKLKRSDLRKIDEIRDSFEDSSRPI